MIQAATAAMNMEGMLDASGVRPIEFRKLDEEGKKVLNKKNPVPGPHHPTYLTMIKGAVLALNEGKGASKPAILKYLAQHYQLGENLPKINSHLCSALKRGTKGGDIEQTKGHGASGSFKIAPAANSAKRSGRVMKKKLAKGKDVDEKKEVKAKTAAAKPKATMKKRVAKKSTGKAKLENKYSPCRKDGRIARELAKRHGCRIAAGPTRPFHLEYALSASLGQVSSRFCSHGIRLSFREGRDKMCIVYSTG
ncbi:hypothetical protein Y032_0227g2833 [Ancylostoma ceylanicum]|nr:hypothetical protein Y032_0227g2833 [Ancylostoma ceylanicum]